MKQSMTENGSADARRLVVFGQGKHSVGIWVHPLGVDLPDKLTFEGWKGLLEQWKRFNAARVLGFADILTYGQKHFGREKVDEALNQLEFSLGDVTQAMLIGQLPLNLRSEKLQPDHYFILGKADITVKEQGRWVAIVTKENLSAMELQKSIEAGKVVRQAEINRVSGRDSGLNTIQGLMFWFERWLKSVGGERDILAWPVETREDWLREVNPILSLAAKIMKTLPVDAEVVVEHEGRG